MGINGLPREFTPARDDLHLERIELHDAAVALAPIFADYPDANIVLKMDCEGSEYGIFKNLEAAGLLGRFQAIMLEWHKEGPRALRDALERHGYAVFTFGDRPSPVGVLYAVNVRLAQRRAGGLGQGEKHRCPADESLNSALLSVAELAKL